jgi:uncharacterized protein YbaR (Trm112 family)
VHILLTDILTCPRCGPQFGLILIADRMAERRVIEGALGCSNCRNRYPVHSGTIRFTAEDAGAGGTSVAGPAAGNAAGAEAAPASAAPAGGADTAGQPDDDAGAALRIAALLGITEGPAYVLLAGDAARLAGRVAVLVEGLEVVVAADPFHAPGTASGAGVNRLEIESPLPLANARMAGVALTGSAADMLLEEGARVLAPLGRLVLEPAPAGAATRLEARGLQVLAHEGDTMIAANRHAASGMRRGAG